MIKLFTDGSYEKNIGRGGWSFIITKDEEILEEKYGTSSVWDGPLNSDRAELEALYQGLKFISKTKEYKEEDVHIYCDNKMVVDGIIGTASRNAYRDIWEKIEGLFNRDVRFKVSKIKSHVLNDNHDNICNMRADRLSKVGRNSLLIKIGEVHDGKNVG